MTTDPARRLAPVVRLAPAKLNLTLAVGARRADGFHEIHSVMVPLLLADRLSLAPLGGDRDRLHVRGLDAGPSAENLVLRAIAAARVALTGSADPDATTAPGVPRAPALAARLEKRIPVAAGLAGGSSDAAAALDGALEAWDAALPPEVLASVAARVGSDVPFFFAGGPAVVEGRGERVTPLPGPRGEPPGVLLVTPAVPISSAAAYAAHAAGAGSPSAGASLTSSRHLADELRNGIQARDLLVRAGILATANDLAAAAEAVQPGLARARRDLRRLLGRPVGLSGSGPTLWALYPSEAEAAAAAVAVRDALGSADLDVPGDAPAAVVATRFAGSAPNDDRRPDEPVRTG
jgi:4-diphosphocytidyl-2-C-methyl-D-erythritol kinase